MTRPALVDFAAVFVGGVLGTAARWGLDALLPHAADEFPLSTLLINVVGSAVLGFLVARVWPLAVPSWLKAGVGAGLLGSFTTFSAVVLAMVTLDAAERLPLAALYLVLTLAFGMGAAFAGLAAGGFRPGRSVAEENE